jgi:hypothetical protein
VQSYPSGFDGGNTDSHFSMISALGHESTVIIPSVVVETGVNRKVRRRGEDIDHYKQDIHLVYSDVSYSVGYLALKQSKRSSTEIGDETRYHSLEQLVRLLATSGLAIADQNYGLSLVTTVPLGYSTKELRRRIRDRLEGTFTFTLNGIERQATITVRKVIVEGPPALVLYGGQSAGQRRLIVNGGGRRTDLTLLDGNDPVVDRCKGIDLGVEDIGDYLSETLREQHGRKLSLRERSDILRAYASRSFTDPVPVPSLLCGRYELSSAEVRDIVTTGCRKVAHTTLIEARVLWDVVNDVVAGDIGYQYHIGGSAFFYNDLLRAGMPHLRVVADASAANARGCARIAKAFG